MRADIAKNIEEIKESVGQLARAVNERGLGTVPELGEVAQRVGKLADAVTSGGEEQGQESGTGNGDGASTESERSRRQQLQDFYNKVYNDAATRVNGARSQVEDFVRDNPLRAIAIGVGSGVAVGLAIILGRRR